MKKTKNGMNGFRSFFFNWGGQEKEVRVGQQTLVLLMRELHARGIDSKKAEERDGRAAVQKILSDAYREMAHSRGFTVLAEQALWVYLKRLKRNRQKVKK